MIRNLIIVALLLVIVYDISGVEFLDYSARALDKLQDLVYNVQRSVK